MGSSLVSRKIGAHWDAIFRETLSGGEPHLYIAVPRAAAVFGWFTAASHVGSIEEIGTVAHAWERLGAPKYGEVSGFVAASISTAAQRMDERAHVHGFDLSTFKKDPTADPVIFDEPTND